MSFAFLLGDSCPGRGPVAATKSAGILVRLAPAACALLILAASPAVAAPPVKLAPYPQKLRTFYPLDAPQAPAELKNDAPRLPVGDLTAIAVATDGAVWLGTARGLARFDPWVSEPDRRQYYAGKRYLPDDEVQQIVADSAAGVWVRTATGISHIELRPMTLEQKAAYFEKRIRDRHDRYGLVASSHLREPGKLETNQLDPSDNDGLWTAMYAAAECFRYAVTHAPEALANARKSIEAVLFLEQVTGRPGFPARSYIRKGDWRGQGGTWHWTPDRQYEWKADTSSDEIVGHFFLFGVAWDLLPDQALRKRVAATATRIMDHILEHGYHLTDITGQPTYWGRWSPEYFSSRRGRSDSPLNALELLSFLRTTAHLTGESRYEAEYRKVAVEMKYAGITARLQELRGELNYSDEELAMLPFYLIFRFERDPGLLATYRKALDQWWENIQRENNPLWTFIYLQGRPDARVDLPGSVLTLYRIPMDLVEWRVVNSHRMDIRMETQPDRFRRPQSVTWLPPDERPVMKWNGNPFRIDGGSDGRGEDDGSFYLLPYWMGRYHRLIEEARGSRTPPTPIER